MHHSKMSITVQYLSTLVISWKLPKSPYMKSILKLCSCSLLLLFLPLCSPIAQKKPIKFAWLSDTHVGGTTGAADLSLSIQDINSLRDIHFVILSGDITEMGTNIQIELAKSILDSLRLPYYIIPGNHDTKWSESGCTRFSEIFKKDRFVFDAAGFRFIGMHQGPIMKMGDGHFAPEDLRWLDSILTESKTREIIFVTHYPLDDGIDNWYEVLDRLKAQNTKVVLVGHGHSNQKMDFEGIPGVMGRSSLRGRQPVGGYTIVTLQTDSIFFSEGTPGGETKAAWNAIPLNSTHRTTAVRSTSPIDFSMNGKYKQVKQEWSTAAGYTIASTPAVWKDYVVVGNSSGAIDGFSLQDGRKLWSYKTGASVYSSPDASDGKVVVGSSDKTIYCLNITDGRLLWKVKTAMPVVAAAKIEQGTVYIGASDRSFRALNLNSGKTVWQFSVLNGFVETRPFLYGNLVLAGAWDTYFYALDKKTGSLVWKWMNGNTGILYSPAACWPVASNSKVFIAAPDRYLTAIDVRSGAVVWRTKRFQVRETIGLSQDGSRVYARCMTDTVIAFASTDSVFKPLWIANCEYGYDIDPSMPVERNGRVYFGTKNGLVIALDAMNGTVLWQHRISETIVHTPVPLDDGRILVADLNGKIIVLKENK
ncbi:MAG: PQQ-binding-like beta-propeller repeat protein [bacterium]